MIVINARHVQVVEENIKLICLENSNNEKNNEYVENENDDRNKNPETGKENDDYESFENNESDSGTENKRNQKENVEILRSTSSETLKLPRKSERKKSPISRDGNPVSHFIYVNYGKRG